MAEPHHMNDAERLESAIKSEQWFEAVELGESLLRRDANNAETLRFASKANIKIGNHATALLLLQSLHEQKPENTGILIALTRAQVVLGDSEKALENFNTITADTSSISPKECHRIRLEIGDLMLRLNKFDELEDMFKEWQVQKKNGPRIASLRFKLMQSRGHLEQAADGFNALTKAPNIGEGLRLQALFDLSKVLDRLGRYDEAFEAARQANEHPAASAYGFDRDAYRAQTDRMISFFTRERLDRLQADGQTDESPVFIIGMPRSGTTLTEQVIAAHPGGAGIGEQREPIIATEIVAHLTGVSFPECIEKVSRETIPELGERYLRMSRRLSNDATRVTNKALGLDRAVGFIQLMLPGSRVIFVRRHPIDNLLSIYLHPLQARTYPWSRSIEDIVFVRREFDRLTDHWMKTSSLPMFDLEYEHFTRTQAETTGRILEFLDLPPAEECLKFHESKRYVRTPSYDQVNKPLNQNAIERWRNYERHLGPAIEAFGK
jgi:tetratricopeptide (TPR) repeat protein